MREILLWVLGSLVVILSLYESWQNKLLRDNNAWHAFINSILIEKLKRYEMVDEDDEQT